MKYRDTESKRSAVDQESRYYDKPMASIILAIICLLLYFLNPSKAHAAWVYIPPDVTRIYAQGTTALGAGYTIPAIPIGTMVFNSTTTTFVDIASLPIASQPPLNPIMVGAPVVSYGGLPTGLDPLNPINSTAVAVGYGKYAMYFMGVAIIGLSLGLSFGGLLGLIRKNIPS